MSTFKKPYVIIIMLAIIAATIWWLTNNQVTQINEQRQNQQIPAQPKETPTAPLSSPNNLTTQSTDAAEKKQTSEQENIDNTAKLPTAFAGNDFSMDEFERTYLEGQGAAFDGSDVTYKWLTSEEYFFQTQSIDFDRSNSNYKDIRIFHSNRARTKFIAPETTDIRYIELYLVVTDRLGQTAADKITITVHNVEPENVAFFDVDMPDRNLRECTEEYANEHLITFVNEITELQCNNRRITDLTGLEYFHNLKKLSLINNAIKDISPLSKLHQLTTINLGKNAIYDLRPLTTLTYLSQLNLHQNQISDVTPLTELNLLVSLNLADNKIDKPQYFGENFHVKELNLSGNPITDLAPLGIINGLETLNVSNTAVKDIFSLFALIRNNRQKYQSKLRLSVLDVSHNDIPCDRIEPLNRFRWLKVISKGICEQ